MLVSYRAHFSESNNADFIVKGRYVVFEFTNMKSGQVKKIELWSQDGWNRIDDFELFEHFLPGNYSLLVFAMRNYENGRKDYNNTKPREIRL